MHQHKIIQNLLVITELVLYDQYYYYSASGLLAMQSAVLAKAILSARLSVRHVSALCPEE